MFSYTVSVLIALPIGHRTAGIRGLDCLVVQKRRGLRLVAGVHLKV